MLAANGSRLSPTRPHRVSGINVLRISVSCGGTRRLAFDVCSEWLALILTLLAHAAPSRVAVRLLVVVRYDHLGGR